MNTGLITSLWSISPFTISLFDYIFFRTRLKAHQLVGTVFIVVCIILLNLNSLIYGTEEKVDLGLGKPIPVIIPILIALFTTITHTTLSIYGKKVGERFYIVNATYLGQFICAFCILIVSIGIWCRHGFSTKLFLIGIVSGFSEASAKVAIQYAIVIGYAGPAAAICSLNGVELIIYQAIRYSTMLNALEIVVVILCLIGSIMILTPKPFEKILCFLKEKESTPRDETEKLKE